jgi:transcriptional regulator with XRE-family HTH domain
MGAATQDMRTAFGKALDAAMRDADISAPQVASFVGLTADAVRKWMTGVGEPKPLTVFAVEALLGVAPGELSRHLGFVPVDVVSVSTAIDADRGLSNEAKRLLLATYRAGRRG